MIDVKKFVVYVVMTVTMVTITYADVQPVQLTCEYRVNPVGIDTVAPRLAWILESEERGQAQTAYQILVASNGEKLKANEPNLWDSGRVTSSEAIGIVYAGKPLVSGQRACWKVRAWDRDGKASAWSEPAFFEMGLLKPDDWKAKWICSDRPLPEKPEDYYKDNHAPLFRKEFNVAKPIKRARAYASGLGYYELRCNGRRVSDHMLDPGWTSYAKRVLYSTYDVTEVLNQGPNAVGIIVGNGWYNPLPLRMWGWLNLREHLVIGKPRAILQIEIDYADGTHEHIVTGPDWKVGDSPILRNSVYLGEVYDARLEQTGWDKPGFKDDAWRPAMLAAESVGPLHAQMQPPIRVTRAIKPIGFSQPRPGVRLFDMGQNFAGVVRLRVTGPAGTRVNLRYGELLNADGTLNGMTSVAGQIKRPGAGGPGAPDIAWQVDSYILKGYGEEEFVPRFTFHGFRYVEVTGLNKMTRLVGIQGLRMNADVQPAGSFSCSNEMFNRIQSMCEWTLLSNLFSVQSDCPQREKFGYGGDLVVASEFGMLNFDMAAFYAKVATDFADAARDNGGLTETAPFVGISDEGLEKGVGPIGWGTVHPMLLWQLYQYYGNRRLLEEQYETARRWVDFLAEHAPEGIITKCIGDHESLVPKATAVTSTAFYWYNASLLAHIADVLGKHEDARRYGSLADRIKEAFDKRFLDTNTGKIDIATQAAQAFALYFGLTPPETREKVLDVLVDDIMNKHKGHLSTGIFGTKYMLNVLTDLGRPDVAYTIVNQKDFPGWGYMLENGATTLWEHWAFSDNTYSHNHPMFGSVSEWFCKAVAGIAVADDAVGADKILLRPNPVVNLTWAEGEYHSVRGIVASKWRVEGDRFNLEVAVPVGVTATLYLPGDDPTMVREGDRPANESAGVHYVHADQGCLVYKLASGKYKFVVQGFEYDRLIP